MKLSWMIAYALAIAAVVCAVGGIVLVFASYTITGLVLARVAAPATSVIAVAVAARAGSRIRVPVAAVALLVAGICGAAALAMQAWFGDFLLLAILALVPLLLLAGGIALVLWPVTRRSMGRGTAAAVTAVASLSAGATLALGLSDWMFALALTIAGLVAVVVLHLRARAAASL